MVAIVLVDTIVIILDDICGNKMKEEFKRTKSIINTRSILLQKSDPSGIIKDDTVQKKLHLSSF